MTSDNLEQLQGEDSLNAYKYEAFEFTDYVEMLMLLDENVRNGTIQLYDWQREVAAQLCKDGVTDMQPLKYYLCAANGVGKDSFVVAPFAVWGIMRFIKATVVITSASGVQLSRQTERYIRVLCEKANNYFIEIGLSTEPIFKINQRYIKCLKTGSEIFLFATDEPGKAEGYHPIEPGRKLFIIANEAKSIPDQIFDALRRCTGYSHWLEVSSPGEPKGHFFKSFTDTRARLRDNTRHVTSYECKHIPKQDIEDDKRELGEHSALFRSKHLALFTTVDRMAVMSLETINKCDTTCKTWLGTTWPKRVGIDLAAGGDETVISIWQGNRQIGQYTFRQKDTELSAAIIDKYLISQNIEKDSMFIRADDGGVGRGVIDKLVRLGYVNITRVLNQSAAYNKREYGNKGAEMWSKVARLIEECLILIPDDEKLKSQLATRLYKRSANLGRIILQSKAEAKAEGFASPDRADAMVLALYDIDVEALLGANSATVEVKQKKLLTKEDHYRTLSELAKARDEQKFTELHEDVLARFNRSNVPLTQWTSKSYSIPVRSNMISTLL